MSLPYERVVCVACHLAPVDEWDSVCASCAQMGLRHGIKARGVYLEMRRRRASERVSASEARSAKRSEPKWVKGGIQL